ncbi:hypothetical protein KM043_009576 [Ampulex compressa]|nr:hypothetical protein KM043_009576 [Ampulex compressa]
MDHLPWPSYEAECSPGYSRHPRTTGEVLLESGRRVISGRACEEARVRSSSKSEGGHNTRDSCADDGIGLGIRGCPPLVAGKNNGKVSPMRICSAPCCA